MAGTTSCISARNLLYAGSSIPAINSRGYYSKSKGCYLHIDEAEGEEKEWIEKYHMLQYNSMFDKKNRSSFFFPYNLKSK